MLKMLRRRWRSALWLVLLLVILLNVAAYFTLSSSGGSQKTRGGYYNAFSHLQVLRKRLNASFNTSSSRKEEVQEPDEPSGNSKPELAFPFPQRRIDDHPRPQEAFPESLQGGSNSGGTGNQPRTLGEGTRANYSIPEVDDFVKTFYDTYSDTLYQASPGRPYLVFLRLLLKNRKKGMRLRAFVNNRGSTSWERFHYGIHQHYLYDTEDPYLEKLLRDLVYRPMQDVDQKEGGTQIKLILTFDNDGQALFKPMRFPREQETLPDHFYFADYERHNSEIAAFHLDRALGFHRVPPTVGRLMNISRDIQPFANSKFAKTFFISPAGNLCFHGQCSYYCDSSHPICGHPVMLEGSLAAFLPAFHMAKRKTWRNPWKRSYSKHRKAYWEVYNDLCIKVKEKHPYNEGRRLLDVLDMSIFDFLTGNLDRHHYETFRDFGNDTFLLHMDNGRGFGKSKYDCISCLAPVRQCCMIRLSTLSKLVKLYQGPQSLSQVMRTSLTSDPVNPILTEAHLDALDRRVSKILNVIDGCLKEGRPWKSVVVDDGVT